MNVFYIPSWYPGLRSKIAGNFFREQALAIAQNYPKINLFISLWGTDDYYLSFKELLNTVSSITNYFKSKPTINKLYNNVYEIYSPTILWSDKLNGYLSRIINVNFKNYNTVLEKYGSIDLIHSQVAFPAGFAAMKIKEKENIPYIITEHMGPFPFPRFLINGKLSPTLSLAYKNADAVIAVSNSLASDMAKYDIRNVKVIPNSVREGFFHIKPKEKIIPDTNFYTLSPITSEKGIPDLIKAIETVCKNKKNIKFRISGIGDKLLELKKYVSKKSLGSFITFCGNQEYKEIIKEFNDCDCFILPSHHESFGVVYAEAIAAGKPVIATKCGGPEDIINNSNGIMVEKENIDELANAIIYISENLSNYDNTKIQMNAKTKYSGHVIASKIKNIYNEVLKSE